MSDETVVFQVVATADAVVTHAPPPDQQVEDNEEDSEETPSWP